jgi:hypothetical protein
MKHGLLALTLVVAGLLPPAHAQSSTAQKAPIGVPADAQLFNGKWYRVYFEKVAWHRAKEKCGALSGQLAVVPDAATWEFIKRLTPATIWLGATDEEVAGVWKWLDGTPWRFTAWLKGLPNNQGGKEHYLSVLTFKGERGWNDAVKEGNTPRREVSGYICEWKTK